MKKKACYLKGKNALVTGASSGLGPYVCNALSEAGVNIAIHFNTNEKEAIRLAGSLKNKNIVLRSDLNNSTQARQLFKKSIGFLGPVSILVNCAAAESQSICPLAEMCEDNWEKTQRINVQAPMILIQEFAKQELPGAIINISSIEASQPTYGHAHYSVSKAALEGLTKASALEFGEMGIRVNSIAPGLINRKDIKESWPEGFAAWKNSAPLGELVQPENIASMVVFLASESASSISGSLVTIDCGLQSKPSW